MKNYLDGFESYLNQKKQFSQNTVISYLRDVKKFDCYASNKSIKLKSCTESDVAEYISHIQNGGMSDATITRITASLRAFYTYLTINGVTTSNPAQNIKFKAVKKNVPRILTSKEIDLLLNQPKQDSLKGYRDKAMLELLYATGIRVSELIELNVNDINTELEFMKCGEGSGERVIPLYPVALSAVKEYLRVSRPLLVKNMDETALFVNLNGARMTRQGFWKIIKYYQEASKIQVDITPHVLRHSLAAHLLENGAEIKIVKEIMGHSDISSTMVYANLIKSNLKKSYITHHPRAKK